MRIRTVKPEFWTHPIMSRMPDRTRLLALALLNHADDHGYFLGDPAIVRGVCCPFREDLGEIREDLAKLVEVGWIDMGRHPEHGIIGWVVSWADHQRVAHPKASKIKPYSDTSRFVKSSGKIRENSCQERKGKEVEVEQGADSGKPPQPLPEDAFEKADHTATPKRHHTLGDLEACHAVLVVFRDDRRTAETLLDLYGWDALNEGLRALTPAAKAREHGKQRVTISELRGWLGTAYTLHADDYTRAGIAAPQEG